MKKLCSFLLAAALTFSMNLSAFAAEQAELVVDNENPVISAEQFRELDRTMEDETLTIRGKNWSYEVRIKEQGSVNMSYNDTLIREIARQFQEQDFQFLSFPSGPVFDFTGTLTINAADMLNKYDSVYVYSYYQGKLSKIWATVDKENGTVSFPTKYFGHFVITDKEIPNGTKIKGSPSSTKPNPPTGA